MRVMIIGASSDRTKFGNKAVRAMIASKHTVFPVNPTTVEIEGLRAFANVEAPPGPIDRAVLYVPPPVALSLLDALAARGDIGELWFSPGTESDAALERARELGLNPVQACAILDVGMSPSSL